LGIETLDSASDKAFYEHKDTKARSRYRATNIAVGKISPQAYITKQIPP
jgi:hypothetical protein